MRRRTAALSITAAFAAGALAVTGMVSVATPADPCESQSTTKRYIDCRMDRIDKALGVTPSSSPSVTPSETPTPEPSVTPSETPSASATPSATPTPSASQTPTPSPTASPAGFPTEATTGVPDGTTLTAYTGPLTITTAGTVIDSKRVTGTLTIRALNVTIRNSEINGSVYNDENGSGSSFTITDSSVKIAGLNTGISSKNFTALRVEVTGGNRSVNCWMDCTVKDSLVWKQARPDSTTHQSGIRLGARSTLIGNTIACDAPDVPPDGGCSAAITGYGDFAQVKDVLVQGNLVKATTGGFCAYGGSSNGKPYPKADNVRYIDNRFERRTSSERTPPTCGWYGTVTSWVAEPGSEFTGNKYTDGATVNP